MLREALPAVDGTIGYVHYGTAKRAGLGMAWLENKAGNYIKPTGTSGLQTLLQGKLPADLRLFMPDPDGKDSYPIVTYSWLLLYGKYDDPKKLDALKEVVRWCLDDGQEDERIAWLSPTCSPRGLRRDSCRWSRFPKGSLPWPIHKTILILCTRNSARSQMAEGILRKLRGRSIPHLQCRAESDRIHPMVEPVMNEIGIDISGQRSKSVQEYLGKTYRPLCDRRVRARRA